MKGDSRKKKFIINDPDTKAHKPLKASRSTFDDDSANSGEEGLNTIKGDVSHPEDSKGERDEDIDESSNDDTSIIVASILRKNKKLTRDYRKLKNESSYLKGERDTLELQIKAMIAKELILEQTITDLKVQLESSQKEVRKFHESTSSSDKDSKKESINI